MSERRRAREEAARPVREALKARVRRCEVCLATCEPMMLAVHEIANGPLRQAALDQLYAVLAVCWGPNYWTQVDCHRLIQNEPEARQLARLLICRPEDYNLPAYLKLTRPGAPRRITEAEVMAEVAYLERTRPEYRQIAARRHDSALLAVLAGMRTPVTAQEEPSCRRR